ncbi:hypothetical protein P3X46_006487 [Hevea brasiliensis]|uniref:MPN domain-containing protein n=1 Tax=Hevea brasiliensis TaxID=3981 RepID=A0ABQ9MTJ7_HEVBR|nr:ER membrane protein complex subunit 8/9 homolog [Hevea brasiliensis]KAJ9182496.1 hypothetical protein P3X46_006487 [Hevea brasiliensis]
MGVGELKYDMSQNGYIKLVLHALKHNSAAVNGVLLGRSTDDVVEITDSVPLFHNHLGILPPLEISLIMIEDYYSAQGLDIVGYFHANERSDDAELGNVAKNIGDHIYRYFPQAAILLLDNKKLEALPKGKDRSPVMRLYTRDATKNWKLARSDGGNRLILKEPAANIVLLDFVSSQKWQHLVDFDDHLDDISKDWLNPDLFK